jgi:hypothetical protein
MPSGDLPYVLARTESWVCSTLITAKGKWINTARPDQS